MTARCPYFGTCGGCQTQHLSYEQQVSNKRERLASLLKPHYNGELTIITGEPYDYRNRMDFITAPGITGFRVTDGRAIVDVEACAISDERINALLREVRAWITAQRIDTFNAKTHTGTLKYAVIRTANDTCISFMLNEDSNRASEVIEQIKAFATTSAADHVVIAYTSKDTDQSTSSEWFCVKGTGTLSVNVDGYTISYPSQGFFQNNTRLTTAMVQHVRGELANSSQTLVDLYGGVGTFAIPLAKNFQRVISIEQFPEAKQCVLANAAANNLANIEAITDDAANFAKHTIPSDAVFVIDPPRSGLSEKALRSLLMVKPPVIAYVSCNPAVLAKELSRFAAFYTVTNAALVDLFPQTNHAEAIITLRLRQHR